MKRVVSVLLSCLVLLVCLSLPVCAAEPFYAAEPLDEFRENQVLVFIDTPDAQALAEEMGASLGAVDMRVTSLAMLSGTNWTMILYFLPETGSADVLALCAGLDEAYADREGYWYASPNWIGHLNGEAMATDGFVVVIMGKEESPAQAEIAQLTNSTLTHVLETKAWNPETKEEEVCYRTLFYTLAEPGEEAAQTAVEKVNETYAGSQPLIEASRTPMGYIDDPEPLTVTDVVILRKAILIGVSDAELLGKYDYSGDGLLSVTDVVLLRKAILETPAKAS